MKMNPHTNSKKMLFERRNSPKAISGALSGCFCLGQSERILTLHLYYFTLITHLLSALLQIVCWQILQITIQPSGLCACERRNSPKAMSEAFSGGFCLGEGKRILTLQLSSFTKISHLLSTIYEWIVRLCTQKFAFGFYLGESKRISTLKFYSFTQMY